MFGYFIAFIFGALVLGYLLLQTGRTDSKSLSGAFRGRVKLIVFLIAFIGRPVVVI